MVNISGKAKTLAYNNGFYIEHGIYQDGDIILDTIDISEEDTDLFISYRLNEKGIFDLFICPSYVKGIPQQIASTRQLTKTLAYVIENYTDC